jgi:hypothetical protein
MYHKGLLLVIMGNAKRAVVQDTRGRARGERATGCECVVRHGHGKPAAQECVHIEVGGARVAQR